MDEIIVAKNLTKKFGDVMQVEVLHGIDISFSRQVFTAVIGPSGSGKTTLLNILSLLEPLSSGQLFIDGIDFSKGDINSYSQYRNQNFGFIFQFHYLLPEFTASENILLPSWIGEGKPSPELKEKALGLMEKLKIHHIRDKYPHEISGGEQQRVAIARALFKNPKVVFADEPTGNLDRENGFLVLEMMTEMVKEMGVTLIMVTHDREIAIQADKIVELVDGRICRAFRVKETGKEKALELIGDRSCRIE
ncbi:MAG: ABC transporter ATP-binding protein [Candidatus Aminicenantales bacterium]